MAPSLLPHRPENKDRMIYFWMDEIIYDVTKNGTSRPIGSRWLWHTPRTQRLLEAPTIGVICHFSIHKSGIHHNTI
jgi:hypothetical protein